MKNLLTATEARADFFNILNRVLYGRESVFIKKAGADSLAKIEAVSDSKKVLAGLVGSLSAKDATIMTKAIAKARNYPKRKIYSLN